MLCGAPVFPSFFITFLEYSASVDTMNSQTTSIPSFNGHSHAFNGLGSSFTNDDHLPVDLTHFFQKHIGDLKPHYVQQYIGTMKDGFNEDMKFISKYL
jgi:hypothetical protein